MIFFSIVALLALEHYYPLKHPWLHFQHFSQYSSFLRHKLDGGEHAHGVFAWCAAVLPFVLIVWVLQAWLDGVNYLLAWAWGVGVLYLTMGLQFFSSKADEIAGELRAGKTEEARQILQGWQGGNTASFENQEIASVTIEKLLAQSHRQTFGVLFWFAILGPAGAVLFRLASVLSMRWRESSSDFSLPAVRVFHALNWIPQRLTALTFAVAGNFEDAMYCWRTQTISWLDVEESVVLPVGAGAIGVRLGLPLNIGGQWQERSEIGMGDEPDADHIDGANSLIWRGLMVWLVIAFLLMVAGWAA